MKSINQPKSFGGFFDYDNAKLKLEELTSLTEDPNLWDNQENALKLTSEKI